MAQTQRPAYRIKVKFDPIMSVAVFSCFTKIPLVLSLQMHMYHPQQKTCPKAQYCYTPSVQGTHCIFHWEILVMCYMYCCTYGCYPQLSNSTSSFLSQERFSASMRDAHRSLYLIDDACTKHSLDALKLL